MTPSLIRSETWGLKIFGSDAEDLTMRRFTKLGFCRIVLGISLAFGAGTSSAGLFFGPGRKDMALVTATNRLNANAQCSKGLYPFEVRNGSNYTVNEGLA
jgi:hypothetical protein